MDGRDRLVSAFSNNKIDVGEYRKIKLFPDNRIINELHNKNLVLKQGATCGILKGDGL